MVVFVGPFNVVRLTIAVTVTSDPPTVTTSSLSVSQLAPLMFVQAFAKPLAFSI